MTKMKELYEKVSKNTKLQNQFIQILQEAEEAGREATADQLISFAKGVGFDVSIQEMQKFFTDFTAKQEGELSDMELDMVAGGKSGNGTVRVIASVVSLGTICAFQSIVMEASMPGQCGAYFS